MTKTAIMQPYFFPYIGYFQLIKSVDLFIVYDNIKYTKKGWINRNRFLLNGRDAIFSVPLKKDSDYLDVKDRMISSDFNKNKFLNQLREAYKQAPYFSQVFPIVEKVIFNNEPNLFKFIHNSLIEICSYLKIDTKILVSSDIQIDHSLQCQEKVIALCAKTEANVYINASGGIALYTKEDFLSEGIILKFIKPQPFEYKQFGNQFVPWLSIIDVMMFNSIATIEEYLTSKFEMII